MSHEAQVKKLKDIMAQFVGFTGIKLPDDVIAKLQELSEKETSPTTSSRSSRSSARRRHLRWPRSSMRPCSATRNWL